MDKLIWLFFKKCILRKALYLEIEEINQQRFPTYLLSCTGSLLQHEGSLIF